MIRMVEYDVIIVGAGSVGVPTALATSQMGLKTLVLEELPSVSQGDNKHAIGGIRATHSQNSKIKLCQRSIEIFSTWQERYGDDISWEQGGYTFIATNQLQMEQLKETVREQKKYGLNINLIGKDKVAGLIPGINSEIILGGTYSPNDGHASPLMALNSFYYHAVNAGAKFNFKEKVIKILNINGKITGIKTSKQVYKGLNVINAAGAFASSIGEMVDLTLPVQPESHEAGITEPVQHLFSTMVVDITSAQDLQFGNSNNYYFYQTKEGQIIFCISPDPPILGTDKRETSNFLPQVAKRMIQLLPKLKFIKVRRTWRGLYPMTPDGNPIIGKMNNLEGYLNAVGMCGQGFMLGPGVGELLAKFIVNKLNPIESEILKDLSLYRDFGKKEKLK